MTTSTQQSPYLPKQRNFPNDSSQALGVELDKAYIDIALRVNDRTIGTFGIVAPVITGEQWYLKGQSRKQQTLRQVYIFTSATSIPHGVNTNQISGFTRIYGTFTDGEIWYPLPYVDVVDVTNQINIMVTNDNIVISAGAGSPPDIMTGFVVLEWLSTSATNS